VTVEDSISAVGPGTHPAWVAAGRFFFRYRDALFPLVFLAILLTSRARWPFHDRAWDWVLNAVGIAVALSGQVWRALVIGLAYIRRGGKDRQVYAESLVQDGIFAHSRNPLYLGNLLGLIGLLIIHNSPAGYVIGVPFYLLAYWAIVCAEEDFLRRHFGQEYVEYCRRVPRFFPTLKGLRTTLGSMRFDWRRLLRKEYGTTFTGLTAICLVLLWDDYQVLGTVHARGILMLWLPVTAAYLVILVLKKRGALGKG
jgi:protein-S-isoprenylcysteine O-methyltransferase Ste14